MYYQAAYYLFLDRQHIIGASDKHQLQALHVIVEEQQLLTQK